MNNQYDPNNYGNPYPQYNPNQYPNNNYNGYNNGYNNYNNWNQMPPMMPPNNNYNNNNDDDSNKGGGILSFLIALILLIAAVAFLLHLLGVINLKELYNKYILKEETQEVLEDEEEKQPEVKDEITDEIKKELDNYCTLIDSEGHYFKQEENNILCVDNICKLQKEDKVYTKDCKNNSYNTTTTDEFSQDLQKEVIFNTLCSNLDSEGNYTYKDENNEYEYTCNNYTCQVKIADKEYTKTCQANPTQ